MVGLTLGLIVTAALLLLFANASAHGQDLARTGMQVENGRYVSEILREDLRLAGFYGETSVAGATYTTSSPCSTVPTGWSGAPLTLPSAIQGYAATDVLGCLADRRAGTAAVAIRRVGVESVVPGTLPSGNTQFHVQYSYCVADVTSPRLIFSKDRSAFTLRNRACTGVNAVRPYVSRIYYVADCNRCGTGGDTIPTLKRVDLVGDELVTTPLAEGVEMLRIEYGFDLNGDGSPDRYATVPDAAGPASVWSNVVALKVHFLTRSTERATTSSLATAQRFQLGDTPVIDTLADGYTRKAYSTAIRLVNPSAVREAQ